MLSRTEMCQNALTRSVITKCVGKDDVGKVFSILALVSAAIPLISDPIMKKVYNVTVEYWPQAFVLLMGLLYTLATIGLIVLRTRKTAIEREYLAGKEEQRQAEKEEEVE